MLSVIFWDPPRALLPWNVPFLGRPILWYGFLFALGFFLGYFLLVYLLSNYFLQNPLYKIKEIKKEAKSFAERALIYAVVGTVVGARLGDVLFYQDWHQWAYDPFSVFRVWEGGLASHGGALGVLIGLFLFFRKIKKQYPQMTFYRLMDLVSIPTALVASLIRLGNFFNQEILGTCTEMPWGVVFGHPADSSFPCPRHPVQLYESVFYMITCIVLFAFWKKDAGLQKPGRLFGLFLVLVFGFRMVAESVKLEQSSWTGLSWMTMGQWLSIPFILWGVFILLKRRKSF